MNLVVDKADNLKVADFDSHFSDFAGVHPSKIRQGKLYLLDLIKPAYREEVMKALCRKSSPYVYFNAEFYDKNKKEVFIHCTAQNFPESSLCRLTLADVSKSEKFQEHLLSKTKEMNYLIDMVSGGVCLFKVTEDMHIEIIYLNESACKMFGTTKSAYFAQPKKHRLDELIHPDDKSEIFQAIGKAMATGCNIDAEFRNIVHKGEYSWCKVDAGIQRYDDDNCPVFHAVFTDITDIKTAEENADRYNDTLVEMFKNLPDAIFCTNDEDVLKLQIVSEDFIKFLGYSRSYLFDEHGGRLSDFINDREKKYIIATIKKQINQGDKNIKVRYTIKTKSGKFYVVEDKRKVVKQSNGTITLVGRLRNVTKKYAKEYNLM